MVVPPEQELAKFEELVNASLAGCTAAVVALLGTRTRWCVPMLKEIAALIVSNVWETRLDPRWAHSDPLPLAVLLELRTLRAENTALKAENITLRARQAEQRKLLVKMLRGLDSDNDDTDRTDY
jgi:hypothetical protein